MRLTVFGATGRTGTEVVSQALAAGHEVTAVVRDPARLNVPAAPALRVIQSDVMDTGAIAPVLDGTDAVVSALGPRRGGPAGVLGSGVRSILAAMAKTGVRRLVAVSASGMFAEAGEPPLVRLAAKPLLRRLLREGAADGQRMEELITASGTEWTIMRPARLTDGPRGQYRTAVDRYVSGRTRRADLADAILTALADPATIGHRVNVGY